MYNPKTINELLRIGGKRLGALRAQVADRDVALSHVRAALPAELAKVVVSAGLKQGKLTIGVVNAVWAGRLRYKVEDLRTPLAESLGADIQAIRIRVVPSQA